MRRTFAIAIMMALGTVPSSVLHNQTFTGLGQNPNTSFGGNGRKKWPRNCSSRKKNVRMMQARHHHRKV